QTVANFLNYVNDTDYQNMLFHRLVPGFVLQGGGFTVSDPAVCGDPCNVNEVDTSRFSEIPADPPVVNEFGRSNLTGTVAMAKLGGNPDSATNQFFVNLQDNSANLDFQNGGFTVFGQVTDMAVVEKIASLGTLNLSNQFPPTSRLSAIGAAPVFVNDSGQTEIVNTVAVTGTSVIEGTVFNDFDGDGKMQSNEGGMFGRTIYVDVNNNGMREESEPSTATDARGEYHLHHTGSGPFTLRMESANAYNNTAATSYDILIGEARSTADFGLRYTGTSWQNPLINTDVDGVNGTTPIDALAIIRELDQREFSSAETGFLPELTSTPQTPIFLDVVGNNAVGPLDANFVLANLLTSGSASAVPAAPLSAAVSSDALAADAGFDQDLIVMAPTVDAGSAVAAAAVGQTLAAVEADTVQVAAPLQNRAVPHATGDDRVVAEDETEREGTVDQLFAQLGETL
ncbi:MAG: peptidylprolyl isomerase, partial [Planctomycetota bacterium]